MKVVVGNTDFFVYWEHGTHPTNHSKAEKEDRHTDCTIYQGTRKDGKMIAQARASLHWRDKFNRYKGRKESMKMCLKQLDNFFNKEHKKLFWDEFLKPVPKPQNAKQLHEEEVKQP